LCSQYKGAGSRKIESDNTQTREVLWEIQSKILVFVNKDSKFNGWPRLKHEIEGPYCAMQASGYKIY